MMNRKDWDEIISGMPNPHLLQTWEWGEVKERFGWQAFHKVWREAEKVVAAALVLERNVSMGGVVRVRMHYTPKGPLLIDWEDAALRNRVLDELIDFARNRGAFLLKIDPDVSVGTGEPGAEDAKEGLVGEILIAELEQAGWHFSNEQVQFRNTVLIDLTEEEDDLLMAMKSKTRYNVRLAGRRGVTVRRGGEQDLEILFEMYAETAVRDGFAIRSREYYLDVWQTFLDARMLYPLVAEVDDEPVSGLMLFAFGEVSWYLYGMSRDVHRNLMPTYLLQWEAIKLSKQLGCRVYDLWGAPDVFDESDSMWGVYRFKNGLGGRVVRTIGAWDLPLRPAVFRLYTQVWPRIMGILRALGRAKTQKSMDGGEL